MGEATGPGEGRDQVRQREAVAPAGQRALTADDGQALVCDLTASGAEWLGSDYAGASSAEANGQGGRSPDHEGEDE